RPWRLGEETSVAAELDEIERRHIRDGRTKYDTRLCSTESLDFISELLIYNMEERKTAAQAAEHTWLGGAEQAAATR
ncbi:unnamed protein product, partial [Ascophyllum nodosum]